MISTIKCLDHHSNYLINYTVCLKTQCAAYIDNTVELWLLGQDSRSGIGHVDPISDPEDID